MRVEAGGASVAYEEVGAGRPVVFLHGMPSSRAQMLHYFEPIFSPREGWRRIYPDLPGMGDTSGPESVSSQDDMLTVVGEFIEQVAPDERVLLVGASYGAYLALGFAYRWGDRLRGLMLSEPMVKTRAHREVPEHEIMVEDLELLSELEPDEQFWTQVAVVQSRQHLDDFRAAIKPGFAAADQQFLGRLAERSEYTFDLRSAPPLTAPTLVVTGRQDSVTGYRDFWELIELFPHATLAVLDRAGHGVASEQPSLYRALVDEFLDRVGAADG